MRKSNEFMMGGRLEIKKVGVKDKEAIGKMTSKEEIMKFIGSGTLITGEGLDKFIEDIMKGEIKFWKLDDDGHFIGLIGINPFLKYDSLTIMIDTHHQGKGYFKKALKLFREMYGKEFYIIVKKKNKNMMRIAHKNFEYVGHRLLYGVMDIYIFRHP